MSTPMMQAGGMSHIDDLIAELGRSDSMKLFHILTESEYGWAILQHDDGSPLTLDEIDMLIEHLVGYREERLHRQIKEEFNVFYPCDLPYINGGIDTRRPADAKRYGGVYFAKHPDYTGLVKVGCSIDVYDRMRGLSIELGKKPLTVVGFIESAKCRQTETLIHKALKEYRKTREWFDETGALKWLKGIA